MEADTRYGELTERHLLGILHYLATWSLPGATRTRVVASSDRGEVRDLLAAVRPFLPQLEYVLEDTGCSGRERTSLEDFVATYEEALALLDLSPEEIPEHWDVLQVTGDRALNRGLFHLLRGRDLWAEGLDVPGGVATFQKGLERLRGIARRRVLPPAVRRTLAEAEALEERARVARQEALVEGALEHLERDPAEDDDAGNA